MKTITLNRRTEVIREHTFETRYEKKHWLFFDWYEKKSSTKIQDDLIIVTEEDFDKILITGNNGVLVELVEKS